MMLRSPFGVHRDVFRDQIIRTVPNSVTVLRAYGLEAALSSPRFSALLSRPASSILLNVMPASW